MFPEDKKQKPTGPEYGSLIEYPKDAPAPSGEALVLEDETASIDQKLAATSTEPGIYLLRDRAGKVLYVGKAKSLRTRVRAYFREGGDGRYQVRFLMKRVRDFDTIVTASEKEALILENNLIKQYKPRYNIRLKDDKSYLSAKVTNHAWPRITVTRKIVKDGGHYFGPFGSADGLRETIDVIRKGFSPAHLHRRGVSQSLAAVPRISDQAMPRAVLPAGGSRRVRPPSARGADAARRKKSRAAPRDARSDEGSRVEARI